MISEALTDDIDTLTDDPSPYHFPATEIRGA
jgi:hypothetical protein